MSARRNHDAGRALPLAFEIEAGSLGQASENFAEVAAGAVERASGSCRKCAAAKLLDRHSRSIPADRRAGGLPGKIKLP